MYGENGAALRVRVGHARRPGEEAGQRGEQCGRVEPRDLAFRCAEAPPAELDDRRKVHEHERIDDRRERRAGEDAVTTAFCWWCCGVLCWLQGCGILLCTHGCLQLPRLPPLRYATPRYVPARVLALSGQKALRLRLFYLSKVIARISPPRSEKVTVYHTKPTFTPRALAARRGGGRPPPRVRGGPAGRRAPRQSRRAASARLDLIRGGDILERRLRLLRDDAQAIRATATGRGPRRRLPDGGGGGGEAAGVGWAKAAAAAAPSGATSGPTPAAAAAPASPRGRPRPCAALRPAPTLVNCAATF